MRATPPVLETISLTVPEDALEIYEAALGQACRSVGFFRDEESGDWTLEGVRERGLGEAELAAALAVAEAISGVGATVNRRETEAEGWLARTAGVFPEQVIGRRLALRGTHIVSPHPTGRITLVIDAGAAFGSGEHGSTRGCLRALEDVLRRRPARVLDVGTGTGVLAIATARLKQPRVVVASDVDPWAVRTARANAKLNFVPQVRVIRADGWKSPSLMRGPRWDLVTANILARPLTQMARSLSHRLAPGGTAILSGLLRRQAAWVLSAHRRHGVVLAGVRDEGDWRTLILRKPSRVSRFG